MSFAPNERTLPKAERSKQSAIELDELIRELLEGLTEFAAVHAFRHAERGSGRGIGVTLPAQGLERSL